MKKFNAILAMQQAENYVKELGITSFPVDVMDIAKKLDIVVQAKHEPGVSGMLLKQGDNFGIIYSTHIDSVGFQRFSISHEIGHYKIAGHPEILFKDGKVTHTSNAGFSSADPYELEADYFAVGLLMPEFLFSKAVGKFQDGLEAIEGMADLCKTSLTATAIRYKEKAGIPVAVIMSTDNKIDYCFLSKEMSSFPELGYLRRGEAIPNGTLTGTFHKNQANVLTGKREANTEELQNWLGGTKSVEVTEEVIGLGSYGKVLTVITTSTFADEEDEEEELERSLTPKFHK